MHSSTYYPRKRKHETQYKSKKRQKLSNPNNVPIGKRSRPKTPKCRPLPPEIWTKILMLDPLTTQDLKKGRLVCKMLAQIIPERLFRTFVFRRDRDDFGRMHKMMEHGQEQFAHDIRELRFETRQIDPHRMTLDIANIMYFYDHHSFERCKRGCIDEFLVWFIRVMRSKQNYEGVERLEGAILKLDRLRRIDVSRKACSFGTFHLLHLCMERERDNSYFDKINSEFSSLLRVIITYNKKQNEHNKGDVRREPLVHLSHDELPVTFFVRNELRTTFIEAAQNLKVLHLNFEATELPMKRFWNNMASALSTCKELVDLRLGFDPRFAAVGWLGAYDNNSEEDLQLFYVPLWKLFKPNTWPKLQALRLDGLSVCEKGLQHLLLGHRTLRSLVLCGIALFHGTWRSLLSTIRAKMSLEFFDMVGEFLATHGYREDWNFPESRDFWKRAANARASGIQKYTEMTHLDAVETYNGVHGSVEALKAFVLEGRPWPAIDESFPRPPLTLQERQIRHHFCINQNGICTPNTQHIDEDWDGSEPDGDVFDWEVFNDVGGPSSRQDVIGPFMYDGDLYDQNGFDANGLNQQGVHFSRVPRLQHSTLHGIHEAFQRSIFEEMSTQYSKLKEKMESPSN
ncbi:hypothetical protein BDZ45DRAFT_690308 [Acephala macrosclerotiorum]|nr:hypothetical protein BDZ45DRAFT_690308 [Acephala macrosclerotiorum]